MALRMCDCAQGLWPCAYCTKSLRLLVLREHSPVLPTGAPVNATVAQQVCSMHQKCFALLVLRSTGVGDSRLPHLCDVRTCTGPLALCMCSLRSKKPTAFCDVAQGLWPCAPLEQSPLGDCDVAKPLRGFAPLHQKVRSTFWCWSTCEGPFKALRMCDGR